MSGIVLTKGNPSISLDKRDIGSGEIVIKTEWDRVPGGCDLDQGLMAKGRGGRDKAALQALGDAFGSRRKFPYFELDQDDRSGGRGETMKATTDQVLEYVDWFGVYLYNYGSNVTLDQVRGAVTTVQLPGMRPIIVHHEDQNGTATAILRVFVEDGALRVQRDLRPFSFNGDFVQKQIDNFWGVGLPWKAGRK
ncbi:MAG TPA: hypothetical protein VJ841_00695 [Candidatus Saccharimonadales bacterium]|nr:hypothetical protein [Candidatus Saccharimonadales bacterium]